MSGLEGEDRGSVSAAEDRTFSESAPVTDRAGVPRMAWLTAAMLFVAVRALPVLTYPLGRDQGTYLTLGRSLLQGRVLYRDLWDNKPPGIFYLYALIGKIFGPRMVSAAVVDLALLLLVSWCIFRFTERYLGPGAAAVAVVVHATWHVEAGYIFTAQPEFFQLPLIFFAYFLVADGLGQEKSRWRARHLAAGALLGAAFWLKYNAVGFLPLLLVPFLDGGALGGRPPRLALTISFRQLARRAGWVLVGFGAAMALVVGYFVWHGALPALRQIQFEVLPRYAAMAAERRRLPLGEWIAVRSAFFLGQATLAATLAALLIVWRRRDLARSAPILSAAALAYISTASQLSFHSYYFATCYPFFAMIWAYLAQCVWEGCRAAAGFFWRRGWRLAAVLVWVLFADLLYWPLPGEFDRVRMDYEGLQEWRANPENYYARHPWEIPLEHMDGQLRVIDYLKASSAPSDTLFLFGGHALICYLSGRECVTRFVSNLGLMSRWTPPAWREEVAQELWARPPQWIVVSRDDALPSITFVDLSSDQYIVQRYPSLARLIASRYRPAADFTSFMVYRRVP